MATPDTQWTIVPYAVNDAATNLQITEDLTAAVASGDRGATLRWYGYTGRAAILGVGQAETTIAPDLAKRGVTVIRRASGGAAVLADSQMLALDAVVPAPSPLAGIDVVEAYRWFGAAWVAAITAVGGDASRASVRIIEVAEARSDRDALRATPDSTTRRTREATCFGTLSPYEVAWQPLGTTPRKLVGLSQVRRRGVALFQAGMYWHFDADTMASIVEADVATRPETAALLHRHVADASDVGFGVDARAHLIQSFEEAAAHALSMAGTSP